MDMRSIPSTGEQLPVVGCGTWQAFDVDPASPQVATLTEVLRALFAATATVIDTSPMYGRAEAVVGEALGRLEAPGVRPFLATKVWICGRAEGIDQMRRSMAFLRTECVDLMQIHNLLDWRTHLATLRRWKDEGRIRLLGITHYTAGGHADLEAIMRREPLDFVQVNYSLEEPEAAQRLLPLAADRGIAVLANRPFGGGHLVRRLKKLPLPDWAGEAGCRSWPQLLLKYVLAHPAVTCVIPGTGNPAHMADDIAAGTGPVLDQARLESVR
jgi:diketogulonate reductase-like aldo/keto reductase